MKKRDIEFGHLLSQSRFPRKVLFFGVVFGVVLAGLLASLYGLSGSSTFCGSCHSMEYAQGRWRVSKHKQFACVECHMPHTNIVSRVFYKARAGLNDFIHESLRAYPAFIVLSSKAKSIADNNCLRCHYSTVENTPMARNEHGCTHCHRYVIHGRGADSDGVNGANFP